MSETATKLPANEFSDYHIAPPAIPPARKPRAQVVTKMPSTDVTLAPGDNMLTAALASGNIEIVREVIAMRNAERAANALIAFNNAFASAKAVIKPVEKNRRVSFKSTKAGTADVDYAHEDMEAISIAIDRALADNGLSYRFRPTQKEGGQFTLTCIISHRDGHFEETTLPGSRDTSGMKNDLQGTMSTMTYLERYTLKLALGLAVKGEKQDDDGRAGGAAVPSTGYISEAQVSQLIRLANEIGVDIERFCKLGIRVPSLAEIAAKDFDHAVATMETKRRANADS
jgi:hypothetical protein